MDKKIIKIPKKAEFLFKEKSRYKVLYGGRGSGKSVNIGLSLLLLSMVKKIRILCARQIQASIKDSVHKLLSDLIFSYKLENYFIINQDSIRGINGSEFIFKGLKNNVSEIKSTQGINYCWCEEAEAITDESWDILIPTIREKDSEIWVSFNPNMKTDATYQRFVVNKPDDCISIEMNYDDNPFFPEVLRLEMEACKQLNYPKYEHIWLGIPNSEAGNLIKMDYFERYTQAPEQYDSMFIVCDTAFSEKKSADNSVFMLCGVLGNKKYILDLYCRKVTFVDLQRDLKSFYSKGVDNYGRLNNIASIYIENKGSGISLIQQLRAEGLPIMELTPTVHNAVLQKDIVADKYTRFLEVEADLCSHYVYIPESASWLPEFERECEAFTGGKQDEHDDACFVAGTKIKTLFGDKNIEDIKKGDYVITPYGLRKVEEAGKTGEKEVIYNKELNLKGTSDHKILTRTSGYSTLRNVKSIKECIKWNLKNLLIWKMQSMLYLTKKNIAEWGERKSISYLIQPLIKKEKIQKDYTLRCRNMSTAEKCQKDILFITKTIIHLITTLTIWSVYHASNILNYIKKTVLNMGKAKNVKNILKKLGSSKKDKLPVYNLKVNGGVYFANGVLVSNCDCLIYMLKTARKMTMPDWNALRMAFS